MIIKPYGQENLNTEVLYFVKKFNNSHEVEVKVGSLTKFKFRDYWKSNDNNSLPNSFTRKIDNRSSYVYKDGQIILAESAKIN